MPTTQTQQAPPPTQSKLIHEGGFATPQLEGWLFIQQYRASLRTVDTSGGAYAETPPPAGLGTGATGQSNQNAEITYLKTSSDGNVFTLNGVFLGPYTLTAQGAFLKIKSDGTTWYKVG